MWSESGNCDVWQKSGLRPRPCHQEEEKGKIFPTFTRRCAAWLQQLTHSPTFNQQLWRLHGTIESLTEQEYLLEWHNQTCPSIFWFYKVRRNHLLFVLPHVVWCVPPIVIMILRTPGAALWLIFIIQLRSRSLLSQAQNRWGSEHSGIVHASLNTETNSRWFKHNTASLSGCGHD